MLGPENFASQNNGVLDFLIPLKRKENREKIVMMLNLILIRRHGRPRFYTRMTWINII